MEKPFENRLLSKKFATEAIRFIQANKKKPFFHYLPFTAPHFTVEAHPDWKGKSAFDGDGAKAKIRDYGDVVEELDHRIGDILHTLLTDRSRKHPEKVQEMQVLAKKRLADIKAHMIPLGGQADGKAGE